MSRTGSQSTSRSGSSLAAVRLASTPSAPTQTQQPGQSQVLLPRWGTARSQLSSRTTLSFLTLLSVVTTPAKTFSGSRLLSSSPTQPSTQSATIMLELTQRLSRRHTGESTASMFTREARTHPTFPLLPLALLPAPRAEPAQLPALRPLHRPALPQLFFQED